MAVVEIDIPLPDDFNTEDFSEEQVERALCLSSFEEFVNRFWEQVPGAQEVLWNWHMTVLCEKLQEMAERVFAGLPKLHDLVINVPPGTSKSTICSILFPAWLWARMPHCRIITASHTDQLTLDLASKSRFVIKSEKYQRLFPEIELRQDQDTKSYFSNTTGGDRLSCTVGGKSPMGFHAHVIICDDPIDPKKAVSEAELRNARDFMLNVLPTRKVNKEVAITVLIMQRLHEGDPSGCMLEKNKKEEGKVYHICIPGELTRGVNVQPPELRDHYIDGLMDIRRLNKLVLKDLYDDLGAYGYAGQILQNPVPPSGGMFKEEYFNKRCKAAPYFAKRVIYCDRAATEGGGCNTSITLMAKSPEGNYYVEKVSKGQWEPYTRNQKIKAFALEVRSKYPNDRIVIWIEREGGASGRDAWMSIVKDLEGFICKEHNVQQIGNKEWRAEPWSSQLAAGNVWIVEDGSWDVVSYVKEHILFPKGIHKDQVDGSSGAFSCLMGKARQGSVGLRVIKLGPTKKSMPRIVVSSIAGLSQAVLDYKSLFIFCDHPHPLGEGELPPHACNKLLESLILTFADIQPKDHSDSWNDPIDPFDAPVQEIMMNPEHGRKLWSLLFKKRDDTPEVYLIASENGKRALSVAFAVCDLMRFPRSSTIYNVDAPDNVYSGTDAPPNPHVYESVKKGRELVIV